MSLVPVKPVERIQFYEDHNTPWSTNATAIGTTATDVTALAGLTAGARTAYNTQQAAQNAAKTATEAFYNALALMSTAGASVISQIRSKAKTSGDPNVYVLAQIPAPAVPAPVAPPGTPGTFKVALSVDGSLDLTWKCTNPAGCTGVVYQVWRRTTATGAFAYLGGTGRRKFTDSSVPAGSSQITYQLQAVRSTSVGAWAQVNVNFGTSSSGQTTASVVETTKAA